MLLVVIRFKWCPQFSSSERENKIVGIYLYVALSSVFKYVNGEAPSFRIIAGQATIMIAKTREMGHTSLSLFVDDNDILSESGRRSCANAHIDVVPTHEYLAVRRQDRMV